MNPETDPSTIAAGDIIQHVRRGGLYEVMGTMMMHPYDMGDGRAHNLFVKSADAEFPAVIQVSKPLRTDSMVVAVIYRALMSRPGEPWLFIRPVTEFTPHRFVTITRRWR